MKEKVEKFFMILTLVVFWPVTLIILLFGQDHKKEGEKGEKSYILGETDDPKLTDIDMDLMDDDF